MFSDRRSRALIFVSFVAALLLVVGAVWPVIGSESAAEEPVLRDKGARVRAKGDQPLRSDEVAGISVTSSEMGTVGASPAVAASSTAVPDWSAVVVAMSSDSIDSAVVGPSATRLANVDTDQVPLAPPLSLPDAADEEPATPNAAPIRARAGAGSVDALSASATPAPTQPAYVQRGQAALATVPFSLSSIGYTMSFHSGNDSYRGLTFTERKHIEVYVRPSMSATELIYVIAHEIGHAIDVSYTSYEDRARWKAARDIPVATAWWPADMGSDLATPAGDFAECFASWAVGARSHSAYGSCAGTSALMSEMVRG